jgi:predicted secreted hydrolase
MTRILVFLIVLTCWLSAADWKQAERGFVYRFPEDHSSHPEYGLEWWYYTGNVRTAEGRRFGYQLTFFRIGVDYAPQNPSRWTVRDLFAAHLAISDVSRQEFHFAEKMNRAGVGWAGALAESYSVWNDGWEAGLAGPEQHRLLAGDPELGLELTLLERTRPVIHGEGGISQKGSIAGNASHYYSITRLETKGRLFLNGETFEVEGKSWMDHEFGTSFLEANQVGWDWFSIQLDNGADLMLFQLRREDGTVDPRSSGTLVRPNGSVVALGSGDVTMEPLRSWASPGGGSYPVTWRIAIPAERLSLEVRAVFPGQELRTENSTGVTYWEGATDLHGLWRDRPVTGQGYLEMTGYVGRPLGRIMGTPR